MHVSLRALRAALRYRAPAAMDQFDVVPSHELWSMTITRDSKGALGFDIEWDPELNTHVEVKQIHIGGPASVGNWYAICAGERGMGRGDELWCVNGRFDRSGIIQALTDTNQRHVRIAVRRRIGAGDVRIAKLASLMWWE